jgi:predicted dehydrogenase
MNGVTGRMGANQHLTRSVLAIIDQGGVKISDEEVILPDPILVGRNPAKLSKIARTAALTKWTTDLDSALSDKSNVVYFDAQTTTLRFDSVKRAIAAGKHIYCEKPAALTTEEAYQLYRLAQGSRVKHGVVQDKLWLPGILKLNLLRKMGFFGKILSVRGEFGYYVFEGDIIKPQRPSWNYKKEDGGGIILDMFCHWRYLLDNLFGSVKSVSCIGATHIGTRWDERGREYACTADDSAYSTFELEGNIIAQFNSSWAIRVRRDDLLTIQVDGTMGSAVAGLRDCRVQSCATTPRPVWNPDIESQIDYLGSWDLMPNTLEYENAFKTQWELFLRHVVKDDPFPWTLLEGAKGVQLAEIAYESWKKRCWVDVPNLEVVSPYS